MQRRRQVQRIPAKTARAIVLVVAALCVLLTVRNLNITRKKQDELANNRNKIATRSKEIKATGQMIRNSDDLAFAEKVAREDLGMVKPREVIYIDKQRDRGVDQNKEDIK